MDNRPPIERVRDNEDNARKNVDDARETYRQKEADLERKAPQDAPGEEAEEDFQERMREKLKESGDHHDG